MNLLAHQEKGINILLTSAGRRGYLVSYFKDALKNAGCGGKVHCANSEPGPAMAYADCSVITPLIYDEAYIPFLLDYCKREEISLLIPLFDIDIPVLAAKRAEFEAVGTFVVTADPEAVEVCNDKWKTWEVLTKNGIPVPDTWLKEEEALAVLEPGGIKPGEMNPGEMNPGEMKPGEIPTGDLKFPLIVKPRWGMGSLSVFQADNREELSVFIKKIRREIDHSYLRYEASQDKEACVLIQRKISGQEYGLDVINDLHGNYCNTIVKKKAAMRSGETDAAITEDIPELWALGEKLSGLLKHRGNLDVDVFEADGTFYVLEMNARFGGGYPFSHSAGVNLPLAMVLWRLERPVPEALLQAEPGIKAQKDIKMLVWGK